MKRWAKISVLSSFVPPVMGSSLIITGCFESSNDKKNSKEESILSTPVVKHTFYGIVSLEKYLEINNKKSNKEKIKLFFSNATGFDDEAIDHIRLDKQLENTFCITVALRNNYFFMIENKKNSQWMSELIKYEFLQTTPLPYVKEKVYGKESLSAFVSEMQLDSNLANKSLLDEEQEFEPDKFFLQVDLIQNAAIKNQFKVVVKAKQGYAFEIDGDFFLFKEYLVDYEQFKNYENIKLKEKFAGELTIGDFVADLQKKTIKEKFEYLFKPIPTEEMPEFVSINVKKSMKQNKFHVIVTLDGGVLNGKENKHKFSDIDYQHVKFIDKPIIKTGKFTGVYDLEKYTNWVNNKINEDQFSLSNFFENYKHDYDKKSFSKIELMSVSESKFIIKVKLNPTYLFKDMEDEFVSSEIDYEMVEGIPSPNIDNVFRGTESFQKFIESFKCDINSKVKKLFKEMVALNEENTAILDVQPILKTENRFSVYAKLIHGFTFINPDGTITDEWNSDELTYIPSQEISYLTTFPEYSGIKNFKDFVASFEKETIERKAGLVFSNSHILNKKNTDVIRLENVDYKNHSFNIYVRLKDGYMFGNKSAVFVSNKFIYKEMGMIPKPKLTYSILTSPLSLADYLLKQEKASLVKKIYDFIGNRNELNEEHISDIIFKESKNLPGFINISVVLYPKYIFVENDGSNIWTSSDITFTSLKLLDTLQTKEEFMDEMSLTDFVSKLDKTKEKLFEKLFIDKNNFDKKLIEKLYISAVDEQTSTFKVKLELVNGYAFKEKAKTVVEYSFHYTPVVYKAKPTIKKEFSGSKTLKKFVDDINVLTIEQKLKTLFSDAAGLTKNDVETIHVYSSIFTPLRVIVTLKNNYVFKENNKKEYIFDDLVYTQVSEVDVPVLKSKVLKDKENIDEYVKTFNAKSTEEKINKLFSNKTQLLSSINKVTLLLVPNSNTQLKLEVESKPEYVFRENKKSIYVNEDLWFNQILPTPLLNETYEGKVSFDEFLNELPNHPERIYADKMGLDIRKVKKPVLKKIEDKPNTFTVELEFYPGYVFDSNLESKRKYNNYLTYRQIINRNKPTHKSSFVGEKYLKQTISSLNAKPINEKINFLFGYNSTLNENEVEKIKFYFNNDNNFSAIVLLKQGINFEGADVNGRELPLHNLPYSKVKFVSRPSLISNESIHGSSSLKDYITEINEKKLAQKFDLLFLKDEELKQTLADIKLSKSVKPNALNIRVNLKPGYRFKIDEKTYYDYCDIDYKITLPAPVIQKEFSGTLSFEDFIKGLKYNQGKLYTTKNLFSSKIKHEIVVVDKNQFDVTLILPDEYVFNDNGKKTKKYSNLHYQQLTTWKPSIKTWKPPKELPFYKERTTLLAFISSVNGDDIPKQFKRLFVDNNTLPYYVIQNIGCHYETDETFYIKLELKPNNIFSDNKKDVKIYRNLRFYSTEIHTLNQIQSKTSTVLDPIESVKEKKDATSDFFVYCDPNSSSHPDAYSSLYPWVVRIDQDKLPKSLPVIKDLPKWISCAKKGIDDDLPLAQFVELWKGYSIQMKYAMVFRKFDNYVSRLVESIELVNVNEQESKLDISIKLKPNYYFQDICKNEYTIKDIVYHQFNQSASPVFAISDTFNSAQNLKEYMEIENAKTIQDKLDSWFSDKKDLTKENVKQLIMVQDASVQDSYRIYVELKENSLSFLKYSTVILGPRFLFSTQTTQGEVNNSRSIYLHSLALPTGKFCHFA